MKIAMIGQKGLPAHSGGIERHVDNLTTRLVAAGHGVTVYCRKSYAVSRHYPREYFGARLVYIPTPKSKHFAAIIQAFLSTLHAIVGNFDIIHYHGIGPSLCAWIPRLLKPRVRVIATFHCQDYFHQKWNWFARFFLHIGEKLACSVAHSTIVVSQTLQQYVRETYGRRAIYIPNSVALPKRLKPELIKKLGLSRGSYILSVSRLVKHKGIHTLIGAYNQLVQSAHNPPTLVIVGGAANTDAYAQSLKTLADENPLIIFTGELSGPLLAELYSNALLFVQSSETEGLSYALLEAMSYGCPVLASDIIENKEVLPHIGMSFRVGDEEDLQEKLASILESKSKPASSAAHYQHVKKYYNIEDTIAPTLQLYQS